MIQREEHSLNRYIRLHTYMPINVVYDEFLLRKIVGKFILCYALTDTDEN